MIRILQLINVPFSYLALAISFFQGAFQIVCAENLDPNNSYTITATLEGNAININWSTPAEINSDYFIVQRSRDGILFDDVMQEIAAGTSSVVSNYTITDYQPYSGPSFYRVVEVDTDGKITHKVSTEADFEAALSMTVHPGFSGNTFNVWIASKKQKQVLLVVRDIQGKEFYSKFIILRSVDEIVVVEPESKLPQGLYTVVASSSNAIFSKKIIITK